MAEETLLLADTFEYQSVPFTVEVFEKELFINGETRVYTQVSHGGEPAGLERENGPEWNICDCIYVRVQPDYPCNTSDWPENVDKSAFYVLLLEEPVANEGWVFTRWDVERIRERDEVDLQKAAKQGISKLVKQYEEREEVKSLEI